MRFQRLIVWRISFGLSSEVDDGVFSLVIRDLAVVVERLTRSSVASEFQDDDFDDEAVIVNGAARRTTDLAVIGKSVRLSGSDVERLLVNGKGSVVRWWMFVEVLPVRAKLDLAFVFHKAGFGADMGV